MPKKIEMGSAGSALRHTANSMIVQKSPYGVKLGRKQMESNHARNEKTNYRDDANKGREDG